jgi:hypothetical protein
MYVIPGDNVMITVFGGKNGDFLKKNNVTYDQFLAIFSGKILKKIVTSSLGRFVLRI